MEHLLWYLSSTGGILRLMPLVHAAVVCMLIYQIDCGLLFVFWLARKMRILSSDAKLDPECCPDAMLVLPTLLRKDSELEGLIQAMRSVGSCGYPGRLIVVACIDGAGERPDLFDRLCQWAETAPRPAGVDLHVTGRLCRCGKAVAIDAGIEYVKKLVADGTLERLPKLFFNMDADSSLSPGALERMAFRLTSKRRIAHAPHLIVTSNVMVPTEQCWKGLRSLASVRDWIALLVGREYLTSLSLGRHNSKLFPATGVSGALYCTWFQVCEQASRYARFMQTLRFGDWLKWLVGYAPPLFSEYRGLPLPEAMTGPGDDTWMAWMACTGVWRDGRICFDAPRTPLHALGRALLSYFSRPLAYDPLAIVYSKTPTTAGALFRQRLRWNSSRVQDLQRWTPSNSYHWQVAFPAVAGVLLTVIPNCLFLAGLVLPWFVTDSSREAFPVVILALSGYATVRTTGTLLGLVLSECEARHWIKLIALPASGLYHLVFNTVTTIIGFSRDFFGFGEPTTFSPESTLRKSGLSRIAIAYRIRRALLLAVRALVFGDVPIGWFWLGWRETVWTPSGFEGWSSGARPSAVYWPCRADARAKRLAVLSRGRAAS